MNWCPHDINSSSRDTWVCERPNPLTQQFNIVSGGGHAINIIFVWCKNVFLKTVCIVLFCCYFNIFWSKENISFESLITSSKFPKSLELMISSVSLMEDLIFPGALSQQLNIETILCKNLKSTTALFRLSNIEILQM